MNFQLGRHVIKDLCLVLADAVPSATTAAAGLFAGQYIELMPVVRQLVEIEFPTATTTVGIDLMSRLLLDRLFGLGDRGRLEVEQMLLPPAFDNPFTPSSVDPSLQSVEFVDCGLVRLLQLLM